MPSYGRLVQVMKHTLKKLSPTSVNISVTLDAAELKHAKQLALKQLAPKVKVAGFRPGKVPAHVAEKNIDPSALASEMVEAAINISLNDIITQEELRVLDRPQIELGEFKPEASLIYTAVIEVLPSITLGDHKKLKSKREAIKVAQADIDQVVDRMLVGMAKKKEVERAAKDGDEAWIDFDGRDEKDQPVAGAKGEDYPLALGSDTFIPGFEKGIVGKKAGDEFELPLIFPKDYHSPQLAGAKVNFKVRVKKVTEVVKPELNDAFAKQAGPFENKQQLLDDIKAELTVQKEQQANDKLKDDLLGELVAASDVPVPELLINDQMNSIEQDTMQNLMYRGMTPDQYMASQGYKDRDEWREKEFKEAAVRRVQSGLVLAELSKVEKIEVTQPELDQKLAALLEQHKDPQMQKQFDTPDARRDIANRVLTEKTIDRLIELNSK